MSTLVKNLSAKNSTSVTAVVKHADLRERKNGQGSEIGHKLIRSTSVFVLAVASTEVSSPDRFAALFHYFESLF